MEDKNKVAYTYSRYGVRVTEFFDDLETALRRAARDFEHGLSRYLRIVDGDIVYENKELFELISKKWDEMYGDDQD